MIALKRFVGVIDGKERRFEKGDKITKAEAEAMDLVRKGLAK
ncbi:hypothetical protein CLV77_1415 [Brevirhabdus pacifica]|nr:hypothetical protein [Brevirhabdus pacifica]PJJ86855.1 hypothetical protein CLV77_1415 [Brevirhabdus pacifica]